ncbi:hypothetical protein PROAA_1310006 [Candidatus Propionivibrio aalborgensis]|uniref:TubC N-terminal docking domain-containing protein n=2 Tax=Candidatus Propionivibrio aalborgensis TaxID=1860101 RepID=A0A1A8XKW4_9RHOO|nr:hypothetical protein PROAA_1310006 [Candidatus Propionivibrio aalborgensis]
MNMAELNRLGILIRTGEPGELLIDAPQGALTPDLLIELRRSKGDLLREFAQGVNVVNLVNNDSYCLNAGKESVSPVANLHSRVKVCAGDTATASRWWLIHYHDRDPMEIACCPEATHAEILERHPDAVAAEPFTPTIRQPSAPLTAGEETAIRAWLALIEKTDPASIAEVIGQCQRDADARDYFTGRAAADNLQKNRADAAFDDVRRTCDQCANLIARRCQAAKHGEIVASRNYEPIRDLPRRCDGYAPGADDPDRRHGRERWPGLIQKGNE